MGIEPKGRPFEVYKTRCLGCSDLHVADDRHICVTAGTPRAKVVFTFRGGATGISRV
jgi:hypothetical protein